MKIEKFYHFLRIFKNGGGGGEGVQVNPSGSTTVLVDLFMFNPYNAKSRLSPLELDVDSQGSPCH